MRPAADRVGKVKERRLKRAERLSSEIQATARHSVSGFSRKAPCVGIWMNGTGSEKEQEPLPRKAHSLEGQSSRTLWMIPAEWMY